MFKTQTNPYNLHIHFWRLNKAVGKHPKGAKNIMEQTPVYGTVDDAIKQYHEEKQDCFDYIETLVVCNDKTSCKFYDIEQIIEERDVAANPEKYGKKPKDD